MFNIQDRRNKQFLAMHMTQFFVFEPPFWRYADEYVIAINVPTKKLNYHYPLPTAFVKLYSPSMVGLHSLCTSMMSAVVSWL